MTHRSLNGIRKSILLSSLLLACAIPSAHSAGKENGSQIKGKTLYQLTNVWNVHLKFSPDQWETMQPAENQGRPGGPRGGGGFGPGMFLAPAFMKGADKNEDKKLTQEEFNALAESWFTSWDKEKQGSLKLEQIQNGLNSSIEPPRFGPGGGGGRPGGGRPGLNLQGAEGKRNGLSSAAGIEFKQVRADLVFEGQPITNIGVRYKGNGTWMQSGGSLKRSLKLDLNEFVKGQKLGGVTTLNLHNNVTDGSWMNEPLSHTLFRDAGVPAPRAAYAKVFVTVPEKFDKQYLGLYSLIENIDKKFLERNSMKETGALLKPVTPNPFTYLGEDWKKYNQTYDPKWSLSDEQKKRIIEFCKLVSESDDSTFNARVGSYLDIEEFARFMAVTVWLSTMDSILGPGQNYYVYLNPDTQKLLFFPWDLDHSFGQFVMMGSQEQRNNLTLQKPWQGENRFLERVYKNQEFQKIYRARLAGLSADVFQPERFSKQVDEVAQAIRPAVRQESETKLAQFEKLVAGQPVEGGQRGMPGGFGSPVVPIKAFVKERAKSVKDQLDGKSQGETVSGFGPPPNAGGGERRGPGPGGGPGGGPRNFGPGNFIGPVFMTSLDANNDETVTKQEFSQGFSAWFKQWDSENSGTLTEEKLIKGINQNLSPFGGGPGTRPPAR